MVYLGVRYRSFAFVAYLIQAAVLGLDPIRDREEYAVLHELLGVLKLDVTSETNWQAVVAGAEREFGKLDILVNNAAEQHETSSIEEISAQQLERTFRTNIFGYFYMAKAALDHMKEGSSILNTGSITGCISP
mgnify:CR=1 FL=1